MAVSTAEFREFAVQCMRWSEETRDAGQRDLLVRVAKTWMKTASSLERRVQQGDIVVPDLRRKLD